MKRRTFVGGFTAFLAGCLGSETNGTDNGNEGIDAGDSGTDDDDGSDDAVSGTVIRKSDVETIEDSPLAGGVVVFVPTASEQDLWERVGFEPPEPEYTVFGVDHDGVATLDGSVANLDDDGEFAVDLDPDSYFVCPGRQGQESEKELVAFGCVNTTLSGGEQLHLTTGEAGVRINSR